MDRRVPTRRLCVLLLMSGALPLLSGAAAQALPIAVTTSLRSVAAEGASDAGHAADADATAALGVASLDAIAPPPGVGAWAAGSATLESEVSTSRLAATAETLAFATAPPGVLQMASAESLYRVEFTATADVSLRLSGSLAWGAEGPSDSVAFVELSSLDTSVDPLLLHFALDGPESEAFFDAVAALREGVAYRLVGFVRSGADALGDEIGSGAGGFAFELVAVPESGTLVLVAAGVALLAGGARR